MVRQRHWVALGLLAVLAALVVAFAPFEADAMRSGSPAGAGAARAVSAPLTVTVRALALPAAGGADAGVQLERTPADEAAAAPLLDATADPPFPVAPESPPQSAEVIIDKAPDEAADWRTLTIRTGDTLSAKFAKQGIKPRELHDIMALGKQTRTLARLRPGDVVRVRLNSTGQVEELRYAASKTQELHVRRADSGFTATEVDRPVERRLTHAVGTITDSLFLAGQRAGLSDALIMELAGVFGWDIDFVLDIRQGDRFAVVYEELYLDGERIGTGNILAADFINQGKTFRALRFVDEGGRAEYYTPEGRNLRKAFLRTPVNFTRISSRFSLGRRHPVLNRIRAHRGVDYAAPRGTPVKATGDGKIVHRGRKGGYGKTIVVRHGGKYSTLYAHLSRYQRGLGVGQRVRQGQIIGYVGSTGLATGPHLHYEFRVNGVHRNPLTVPLPSTAPLQAHRRDRFAEQTRAAAARLNHLTRTELALNP